MNNLLFHEKQTTNQKYFFYLFIKKIKIMLSTLLPFYLLPPVTKFRGVFGGRKLTITLPKRDEYAIGDNVYQLKHVKMKL